MLSKLLQIPNPKFIGYPGNQVWSILNNRFMRYFKVCVCVCVCACDGWQVPGIILHQTSKCVRGRDRCKNAVNVSVTWFSSRSDLQRERLRGCRNMSCSLCRIDVLHTASSYICPGLCCGLVVLCLILDKGCYYVIVILTCLVECMYFWLNIALAQLFT